MADQQDRKYCLMAELNMNASEVDQFLYHDLWTWRSWAVASLDLNPQQLVAAAGDPEWVVRLSVVRHSLIDNDLLLSFIADPNHDVAEAALLRLQERQHPILDGLDIARASLWDDTRKQVLEQVQFRIARLQNP